MPREDPAKKDKTQSSVSDTEEGGVEKSQDGDPGVEEQEPGKPAVEQSAADAPESHQPDKHHPEEAYEKEKKQMKSEAPENEPTDVKPPRTEDPDTDITVQLILPKKELDTDKKVPEKEKHTGKKVPEKQKTSPSKTAKNKGKKKPSARKAPQADVGVTKGKTESPGKKETKKRKCTATEEETSRKRIKLSAEGRNLPSGETAAPKSKKASKKEAEKPRTKPRTRSAATGRDRKKQDEKQVTVPGKAKKKTEKTATAVGKSSKKKTEKRKADDKTREETVTPAKTAKKKVKKERREENTKSKDIGSQETKTAVEKTAEGKRPQRSAGGSTVTSSQADPSTAILKGVEAEGGSPEGGSAEAADGAAKVSSLQLPWEETQASLPEAAARRDETEGSNSEEVEAEGASTEGTSAEVVYAEEASAEVDGESEKTSALQMPREESAATEQEVVALPGEGDESDKDVEPEGTAAATTGVIEKTWSLELPWDDIEAPKQEDVPLPGESNQDVEARGSSEVGSAEAADGAGKVSALQLLWEETQASLQKAATRRDESDVSFNEGVGAGGSPGGDSAEAADGAAKVSSLQLAWEETQASLPEAAARRDETEGSNSEGVEAGGSSPEGGSEEAANEGLLALQRLWEETQASLEQEAAARRAEGEASNSEPVQPTPGTEAGSGDESAFIAQLDDVSLVKIKCTTLYLGHQPIPVYFGDFSIPEVISSYDPNNVPMEQAEYSPRGPEPAASPHPGPEPAAAQPEPETTDVKPPGLTAEDLNFAILSLSDLSIDDITVAELSPAERNNLPSTSRKETSTGGQGRAAAEWVVVAAKALLQGPRPIPARRHSI